MRQPRRRMDHGAAPCRGCGSEGGVVRPDCRRPWRGRGYCAQCYDARRAHGELERSHHPQLYATHEQMLWHTTAHRRQPHALHFRADYDRAAVEAEAEAFAADWLATHPQYLAKWCPPEARAA